MVGIEVIERTEEKMKVAILCKNRTTKIYLGMEYLRQLLLEKEFDSYCHHHLCLFAKYIWA